MSRAKSELTRRNLLKYPALICATGAFGLGSLPKALAADTVSFATWAAAVEQVKAHIHAFETAKGIKVEYSNAPWAQYRDVMIAKLVANAPIDVLWVSDAWLPEWADAGWLQPIDSYKELTKYNADVKEFANESLIYKGHQYGLTYYGGFMSFLFNEELLQKAGITRPPQTWDEVTEQALKIKQAGISEYPIMLALANETWLIEFLTAMVYSNGGRFASDKFEAEMHIPNGGAVAAVKWIVDAVNTHKIVSPACVQTGELTGLKAYASGNHAFTLLAENRLRMLNDPQQSQVAGRIKMALMPKGPSGSHATVAWTRFYGLTKYAASDRVRAANAVKLIEWFGGKANGEYKFQKIMYTDIFAGFVVKPLFNDPEVMTFVKQFADLDLIGKQLDLARRKDTMTPWFGEWNDNNGKLLHAAILKKETPESAMKKSADLWMKLKKETTG
jgi:multiple sugar transport system substrate-binding protein